MNCTSSLVGIIFNDSNIAKNFASARTKTAAIITGVLSPYSVELLSKDLQKVSFVGMGTDRQQSWQYENVSDYGPVL